jgi:hypothetical protein
MQTVVETPDFIADAKKAGVSDDERKMIVDHLARNPGAGDLISGSGGARKVRFAGRGKGKSGGYRVITYFGGGDIPVFLLNVFAKGDRVNLSKSELNVLRHELAGLADDYRKGARRNVKGRK